LSRSLSQRLSTYLVGELEFQLLEEQQSTTESSRKQTKQIRRRASAAIASKGFLKKKEGMGRVSVVASVLFVGIVVLACYGFEGALGAKAVRSTPMNWDLGVAYTNLMYSYATYCSNTSLDNWSCAWCQYTDVVSKFQ